MSRLVVFLLFVISIPITNGLNSRKLDEGEGEVKCGGCPCGTSCTPPSSPPPPPPAYYPPPSPPPPPPAYYPPPSPPPPKKPPSSYCPPPSSGGGGGGGSGGGSSGGNSPYPPNSQSIYMTGPPGNLYPIDHDFSSAKRCFSSGFSFLISGFLLGLLSLW